MSLPQWLRKLERPRSVLLQTSLSYFIQRNWFWNWFWKTISKIDLDFKWADSQLPLHFSSTVAVVTTKKLYSCPPAIGFQKLHQPPQCLIWAINHKFALRFSSVRSRATAIFNSNLTTWRKYFGVSSIVYDELMHSGKPCPLIICKGRRTPEKIFLKWNDKIIVGWKAIHHHRADQNPHQRWSCPERKPALHHPSDRGCDPVFSRASRTLPLDAICTHSAEMGFCLEFEHDSGRVCQF